MCLGNPAGGLEGGQVWRVMCVLEIYGLVEVCQKLVMSQQMIGFDVVYIITWPDFRYLDVGDILQYMELMGKKWQDVLAPRVLREGL